jgi:NifU-like protein involved in Fe-S cluster formation
MLTLYTDEVPTYLLDPAHAGATGSRDGVGQAGDPRCGDLLIVFVRARDGGSVTETAEENDQRTEV